MIDYLRQMPLLLQVALLTAALLAVLSLAVVMHRASRQVRRLRQLADAIAAAGRSSHVARALEAVLETISHATGARAGLVYLLDRPEGTFTLKGTYGPKDGVRQQVQWGEEGWPIPTLREVACCEGWAAEPLGLTGITGRHGDVTAAFAPVSSGDRLLGALVLAWPGWRIVGDDVAALIAGVGEHLGAIVENLEMQDALRAQASTLDEMVEELRERDEERRRLIEEIAHDIRSPLSASRTRLHLALQDGQVDSATRTSLEIVLRHLDQALGWANDLLDAEVGRGAVRRERVDVSNTLAATLNAARVAVELSGVELQCEIEEGLSVWATQAHLARVLDNLIGNAIRHTPQGGHVAVYARRDGGCALFSVEDSGPGIAPERLERLFERYYHDPTQEQQGLRPGGRGWGLGLAIARRLVELHGGCIWAESTPGQGSTFFFTLPLYDETAVWIQELRAQISVGEEDRDDTQTKKVL